MCLSTDLVLWNTVLAHNMYERKLYQHMKCLSCENEIPQAVIALKPKNCLFCGASIELDYIAGHHNDQLTLESLWYKDGFHTFPSVLAHEY